MKKWLLKVNRTLFELETGILLFALACQVVIAFFPQRGEWSRGLWIGILTACLCAFHMWYSLDKGLSLTEKGAAGYLGRQSMLRMAVVALVLVICAVTSAGNLLTAFIGVMGLKVSAYLQPVTKKISRAVYGEEILPDIITENPVDEQETRR